MCTRERLSGFLFQNYPDPNQPLGEHLWVLAERLVRVWC